MDFKYKIWAEKRLTSLSRAISGTNNIVCFWAAFMYKEMKAGLEIFEKCSCFASKWTLDFLH